MLEIEVFGSDLLADPLPLCKVERLCALALASAGVRDGHLAVEFVEPERIAQLNGEHRGKQGPTDVLSFPIDGADPDNDRLSCTDTETSSAEDSASTAGSAPAEDPVLSRDSAPVEGSALSRDSAPAEDPALAEGSAPAKDRVPRELGDIVICPACTRDVDEAIVHGALHLVGMDHETDDGEMLAVQAEILRWGDS